MWEDKVLFLDGEAIVIDKPAGLAVHPGPKTRESLEAYIHHLRFGFRRDPMPAHRLDRDTSGCLLLARHPKALARFQRAFETRAVEKTYVAILDGMPAAAEGRIDLPLSKTSSERDGWRIVPDPAGRAAVTVWRVIGEHEGRAAVLLTPETGRTHQLRVHAAEGIGLPIVGDPVYGAGRGPMLLHALSLRMERAGKNPVEAEAPLPPTFVAVGFGDVRA